MSNRARGVYNSTPPTVPDGAPENLQIDSSGNLKTAGNVASGAADSGNPVKVGGRYNATIPTLSDGQRGDLQVDSRGNLSVAVRNLNGSSGASVRSMGDTLSDDTGLVTISQGAIYDGLKWNRLRTPSVFKPQSAVAMASEVTVWTPASGKKFRLMGYHLASDVAGNVTLRDNTAGTTIAVVPVAAGGAGTFVRLGNGILSGAANRVLTAQGPAASALSGMVFGTEE